MKTILAPVDFSVVTSRVVAVATALGKALGARVALLHVCEPSVTIVDYAVVNFSLARVDDAIVKAATPRLEALQRQIEADGLCATMIQTVGSPVEDIIEQAATVSADYVVMGSHGHSALHDFVAGSTTHGVLKRAHCPVVIVPTRAEQQTRDGDAAKEPAIK